MVYRLSAGLDGDFKAFGLRRPDPEVCAAIANEFGPDRETPLEN